MQENMDEVGLRRPRLALDSLVIMLVKKIF